MSRPFRIEAEGHADYVEIRIIDCGVGIEPDNLARIFDPFVQADTTIDRAQGGLGVGLAWVREIVRMHGGTVVAASPGKGLGSTFTVRLPRRRPRPPNVRPGAAPPIVSTHRRTRAVFLPA